MKRKILSWAAVFALGGAVLWLTQNASALPSNLVDMFSQNNILFYDPEACIDPPSNIIATPVEGDIWQGTKYDFSSRPNGNKELRGLWAAAASENENGMELQLSFFPNIYEYERGTPGDIDGLIGKVTERYDAPGHDHGWFHENAGRAYYRAHDNGPDLDAEQMALIKDILENGNRRIPPEINEHDNIRDLKYAENNGQEFDVWKKSQYKSEETILKNCVRDGCTTYTFYIWANGKKTCGNYGYCGDPFGYIRGPISEPSSSANSKGVKLKVPAQDWLTDLNGFIKDEVSISGADDGRRIDSSAQRDGQYVSYAPDAGDGTGLPGFIILHLTAADNFGARSWKNYCGGDRDFYCPPHFTIDVKNKEIFQHFPLSHPSAAVVNRGTMSPDQYGIQIEIVGHGGSVEDGTCIAGACSSNYLYSNFTNEDWDYVAELMIAISKATGIPLRSTVAWANSASEAGGLKIQSDTELKSYIGVLGHTHINGKFDPLNAWRYIEEALVRANYSYNSSESDNSDRNYCPTDNRMPTGRRWPLDNENDGGHTEDGFTYYWQSGPTWGGTKIPNTTNDQTISGGGCGYAATAMVITALTGKFVTPKDALDLAARAHRKAFYSEGSGTGKDLIPAIIDQGNRAGLFNLTVESHTNNRLFTKEHISGLLRQGKMLLFTVGNETNSTFTNGGHWIAIRGITTEGKWKVFSSSKKPSSKVNDTEFDPDEVIPEHTNHRNWWHVVSN